MAMVKIQGSTKFEGQVHIKYAWVFATGIWDDYGYWDDDQTWPA
jgi:hypothetical protein